MQESIYSSSAHNIWIDHSNICFQCLVCGEIPLTFCLQASHYLAFLLKTSPATKSVVSGLYQGVFQLEAQMEETRLSLILRQGFSHHSPGNNTATGTFLPIWTLHNLLQDTRKQQSHVPPATQPETFWQVRGTLMHSYWDVIVITTLLGRWHPRWWARWRCHQLLEYDGMQRP